MKKLLFNIFAYTVTVLAIIILLGSPTDNAPALEVVLWKGGASLWLLGCFIYDMTKPEAEQIFDHNVKLF